MTGRLLFIGTFAIYDRLANRVYGTPSEILAYQPKVAVLIPAYNEEKVIVRTVRSALNSDYSNIHVIVIDDGSKDQTLEVARRAFAAEEASGRVLILTKPNSGKADALNVGLQHLTDEVLFVGIDADTVIAPDAISRLVPHFLNPKVGAVAGNAKVGNRINLWTRWQALEYITSQNFERRALNTLGAVSVVPGAIGAWRVEAVQGSGRVPSRHGGRRRRLDDGSVAEWVPRGVRGPRARFYRSSGQRKRLDAAAVPLVVRDSASGVEALRGVRAQRSSWLGCASEHSGFSNPAADRFAAHRSDVCGRAPSGT